VPISAGPAKGRKLDEGEYGKMLKEFYSLRGWDPKGHPSAEKAKELDLEFITADLQKVS